ncbi:MAG: hypothetical protein ACI8QD_000016 [Cyclobacteriaceae bacterium]|jgi:hypothetical protein
MLHKKNIGSIELVSFPEFDINNVRAKIDTGAYTSSLHCVNIKEKQGVLFFALGVDRDPASAEIRYHTQNYKIKAIKSSNGQKENRYVIKTKITLKNKTYIASFSLANRSKMKNTVLIGRKLLANRFLVDVSLINAELNGGSL